MSELEHFKFNNGGWKGAKRGDCVARAISIATEKSYDEIFNGLLVWAKEAKDLPNSKKVYTAFLHAHGWKWKPTMGIGTGCKVHLKASELPKGRIICRCSHHLVAVVDGEIQDTYNPSRDGSRCVYGYFYKEKNNGKQ
jgi:hypothetical protein|tara:strand:- start:253 stop:666 length:414 start_codon:yes stop_codon:yes gene_type:complete